MGVIAMGVDHSAEAKAALRFALEEAKLRRATLRVVPAGRPPRRLPLVIVRPRRGKQ